MLASAVFAGAVTFFFLWSKPFPIFHRAEDQARKQVQKIREKTRKLRLGLTRRKAEPGSVRVYSQPIGPEPSPGHQLLASTSRDLRAREFDRSVDIKRDGNFGVGRVRVHKDRFLDAGVRDQIREEVRRLESEYEFQSSYSLMSRTQQQQFFQKRAELARRTMNAVQRFQGDEKIGGIKKSVEGAHPVVGKTLAYSLSAYSLATGLQELQLPLVENRIGLRLLTDLPEKKARVGLGAQLNFFNTEFGVRHEAGKSYVNMQFSRPCFLPSVVCSVESNREVGSGPVVASATHQDVVRIRYDLRF